MTRKARIVAGACVGMTAAFAAVVLMTVFSPARTHLRRGNELLEKCQDERAIEEYTKAIALDPGLADAYNGRGIAHNVRGEFEQAIEDFSRAIELDGGFAEAYRNRGRAQHGQLKHAEAITDLSKA
ncbi:MAG: tetratricopeptide repeat protein, partial [Planctomycetota bacterium]